jgi:UDP-galactopyranose mutase
VIDAVADQPRITANTGIAVSSIERENATFLVTTGDGRRLATTRLAIAVPPPSAAELLADAFPELAARLAQIQTVAVESVGVVIAKDKLTLPPVAGIVPVRDIFYSAVTRDTVPDDRYRAFTFHFRPGTPAEERLDRITALLRVDEHDFEAIVERRVDLPSPVLGHQQIVDDIDRFTADLPLFITGNYFAGLAIEDCVSRTRDEFARLQRLR